MSSATATKPASRAALAIAESFVTARREGRALPAFPGVIPQTMDLAYACQEAAIEQWPDAIAGWKVGRVAAEFKAWVKQPRLAGPIFSQAVWRVEMVAGTGAEIEVPVFDGGFAAVEAEFVFQLLADAPAGKTEWTVAEVEALPYAMHVGIEMAGSPLATINDLGPTVVATDFGNNAGLVLGPVIHDWAEFAPEALSCQSFIDERSVGQGSAASIPEGPMAAVAFLLGHAASRGRPLQAGQLVSTGAATGIHDIAPNQRGRVSFGRCGEIRVRAVAATARG